MTATTKRDPVRVLLADDEEDMRILMRMVLVEDVRIEIVAEASSGEGVIEELERLGPPPPSVLVLDHRMPGLTGLDVAEQVLGSCPSVPIVLFSAFLTDAVREQARRVGIRRCMSKDELAQLPAVVLDLARN